MISVSGRFRGKEVLDSKRKHLEPDEVSRFFEKTREHSAFWDAYFRLQYFFGCRVSEPALVLKEDVSFKTNEILIRRLKKRRYDFETIQDPVTGKKKRQVVKDEVIGPGFDEYVYELKPRLLEVLQAALDEQKPFPVLRDNPWLFASSSTEPPGKERLSELRTMRHAGRLWRAIGRRRAMNAFTSFARAAALPRHLSNSHVLRHTRATLLLAGGMTEQDVQYLLGHSSINVTRQYLHVANSMRQRMNNFAALGDGDF